jgi:hypothetical protein
MSLSLHSALAFVPRYRYPGRYEADTVEFNESLLAPYGLRFEPGRASQGRNFTFSALAEQMLYSAASPLPVPDLLILAYALPDPRSLEKMVCPHLASLLGSQGFCCAISDQGLAAPFTALRVAGSYARSGRCRSLALFILEQATFPYEFGFGQDADLTDSGVLLFLTEHGSWDVTGVRSADSPAEVPGLIRIPAGQSAHDVLIVAGPWLDLGQARPDGLSLHRAPPGSYCTSVWLELAQHHQDWAREYTTIILCDTDPGTGVSQAATLSRAGHPAGPPGPGAGTGPVGAG